MKLINLNNITLVFTLLVLNFSGYSQGCSDAGFCTMGAMRPDQHFGKKVQVKLRSFEINQYMGVSRFGDIINSTTAEFNVTFTDKVSAQIKMPYVYMKGSLGSNNGTGDISLSITKNILRKDNFDINFSLGTKIPTNHANAERVDGVSLPMYYQTSLGTYDFVAGISLITRKWLLATGYQQVVADVNNNDFSWAPWRPLGLFDEATVYHPSKDFERGNDVMFRIERNFRFSKFNVFIGLLDILRLNEDKAISPVTSEKVIVENDRGTSNGHATTLLWGGGYNFNTNNSIKLLIGNRLIKRQINIDGLSRELVISTGYILKF